MDTKEGFSGFNGLLPMVSSGYTEDCQDYHLLSKGIISGGADTFLVKFNVRSKHPFQESIEMVAAATNGMHTQVLRRLTDESVGIYFEDRGEGQKLLTSSGHEQLAKELVGEQVSYASGSGLKNKFTATKEGARRRFSSEPISRGVIIIKQYYKPQDNAAIYAAISSRTANCGSLSAISNLHITRSDMKAFSVAFFVDQQKKISSALAEGAISSLSRYHQNLSFNVKTKLDLYQEIRKLALNLGLHTNLSGMPECGISNDLLVHATVNTNENYIRIGRNDFQKGVYDITLGDMKNEVLVRFFISILAFLESSDAATGVVYPYHKILIEHDSTYLPDYPETTKSVVHLDYPGSLHAFLKD
jgi:hypothetical protein